MAAIGNQLLLSPHWTYGSGRTKGRSRSSEARDHAPCCDVLLCEGVLDGGDEEADAAHEGGCS